MIKFNVYPSNTIEGYTIIKKLGEGKFGKAFLAKKDNNTFVFKVLKKRTNKKSEKIHLESEILKNINRKKIPRYKDFLIFKNKKVHIIEYKDGISIEKLIKNEKKEISRENAYFIIHQLLEEVAYLHSQNIVHRDLRISNILLNELNEISIIDFGLARYIDNKKYFKKDDMWHIGDTLLFMLYSSEKHLKYGKVWFEELHLSDSEKEFIHSLLDRNNTIDDANQLLNMLDKIIN